MAGNKESHAERTRSLKDINDLADVAGVLHRTGTVQCLSYSNDWMKDDYKLIELPKDILNALEQGDTLTIRGGNDDDAVLCTRNKTYEIKSAETSNSLLLLSHLSMPKSQDFSKEACVVERQVCSCFSSYYEVRLTRPQLERLRNFLKDNAYSDQSNEDQVEKCDMEGLLSWVQASEEEVRDGLNSLGALQINGFWRLLDINYQEKAFAQVLALIEEKSWDWKSFPLNPTCQILEELYPRFVLEHCLKIYGKELSVDNNDSMERTFCLDEVKVCQYYAEYILRPVNGKFNYHEFMEAWKQSVPDGMEICEDYLLGIALTDLNNHPPVVWHFPECNLPDDPLERFNKLFKTRAKWKERDIEPYIKNLVAPGQKLSSLYLKFTRTSKDENGGKLYNSKRPTF